MTGRAALASVAPLAGLGRGLLFALLWWALAEGRPDSWDLGLVAVAAALGASLVLLPPRGRRFSVAGLLSFLGFFLGHSVLGGIQVAAMALRPRLDLQPALVELPLALPPGAPQVLLTAALGMMPGTLGVELGEGRLRFHVLDSQLPAETAVRSLEARIRALFGERP